MAVRFQGLKCGDGIGLLFRVDRKLIEIGIYKEGSDVRKNF